jgi:hypothetical protein
VAGLYQTQGRYGQAEPLFQRSLAIWEKALGSGAPERRHDPQQPGAAPAGPKDERCLPAD